jgi:L-ascorbate peroxidase
MTVQPKAGGEGDALEDEVRDAIVGPLAPEQAPAHLRLAFHDAGTYDVKTHSGGAHGAIHLLEEMARAENAGWSRACVDLLVQVKERYPRLSWSDLVAVGGAAAVQECGGPVIRVGLGRVDATEPAPTTGFLRATRGPSGCAHTSRRWAWPPATWWRSRGPTRWARPRGGRSRATPNTFSNAYFRELLAADAAPGLGLLPSDRALLQDPELRPIVELYARDEATFLADFADAYVRLTWLGGEAPIGDRSG